MPQPVNSEWQKTNTIGYIFTVTQVKQGYSRQKSKVVSFLTEIAAVRKAHRLPSPLEQISPFLNPQWDAIHPKVLFSTH